MAATAWQDMLHEADGLIWCTPATQAWRQSEAAVWEEMPERLRDHAILLITRFDKLTTQRDRVRVINRVSREVDGGFRAVLPISLTEANAAGDNPELWAESGAAALGDHFVDLISDIEARLQNDAAYARAARLAAAREAGEEEETAPATAPSAPAKEVARGPGAAPRRPGGISPRRITPRG